MINVSPSCSCVLGGCQAIAMWLFRCLRHCYSVATVLLGCSGGLQGHCFAVVNVFESLLLCCFGAARVSLEVALRKFLP